MKIIGSGEKQILLVCFAEPGGAGGTDFKYLNIRLIGIVKVRYINEVNPFVVALKRIHVNFAGLYTLSVSIQDH